MLVQHAERFHDKETWHGDVKVGFKKLGIKVTGMWRWSKSSVTKICRFRRNGIQTCVWIQRGSKSFGAKRGYWFKGVWNLRKSRSARVNECEGSNKLGRKMG